jgi:2-oxoisovalerate dehydrogenase E2 component (dihydrolipoyl transacylase)
VSQFVFKLPDLGEGTVEAEIVDWRVKPGDQVAEDDVICEVMTEKAAVELPSPVSGRVVSTTGQPGDMVPVGSALIVIETGAGAAASAAVRGNVAPAGDNRAAPAAAKGVASAEGSAGAAAKSGKAAAAGSNTVASGLPVRSVSAPASASVAAVRSSNGAAGVAQVAGDRGRVATSPAIRRRAHEAGVDLSKVPGSGPNGRIVREDFDAYVEQHVSGGAGSGASHAPGPSHGATHAATLAKGAPEKPAPLRARAPASTESATEEIKVIGIRRLIAQRMSEAKRNIPHFAYVEEMDVTDLEALRRHLNSKHAPGTPSLTYLPFLVLALVRVLKDFPQANAQYDAERGVIIRHRAVHVGVATQTPDGLKVPVVRDAQALSLWDLAAEMRRVSEAARTNKATREELGGSTITVTSLGKLGGIASTPIINAPEVAIIGVNRAVERPVVLNGAITIRRMMNLSSSFDHRFVDGYDAAALIQALKERIEHPATIFIDT